MRRYAGVSGKGGSCKSTDVVNLAVALASVGKKVGLADLDITGPNTSFMLKMDKTDAVLEDYKLIKPFMWKALNTDIKDIEVVSMSFFTDSLTQPFLMKGNKRALFVQQFLEKVAWSKDLDYMLYDMPPTAGSEFITIVRDMEDVLDGVFVAAIPSKVCMLDVERTLRLCKHLDISVLGIINNMAFLECECGKVHYPFGNGVNDVARRYQVDVLGEIPIVAGADENILTLNKYFRSIVEALFAKESGISA